MADIAEETSALHVVAYSEDKEGKHELEENRRLELGGGLLACPDNQGPGEHA